MDGVIPLGNCTFHIRRSDKIIGKISHYELIIADYSDGEKRMIVLTAESLESELVELDCNGMREDEIIDLNREGRRWEGGELNGKPFGFGYEYSENDNLVYEGFVYEGMKVCFGKEFNDNEKNNCLVYEGNYYNGERYGRGISYNLRGVVDYDGKWVNNHVMMENQSDLVIDNLTVPISIAGFIIDEDMFNDENITLHFFPLLTRLKRIEMSNDCFQHVRDFVLDDLPSLEIVKIGKSCFKKGSEKRDDGRCRITKCPNLRQLTLGKSSFQDFKSFKISNVNSLQSIKFGEGCFQYADFLLKGKKY